MGKPSPEQENLWCIHYYSTRYPIFMWVTHGDLAATKLHHQISSNINIHHTQPFLSASHRHRTLAQVTNPKPRHCVFTCGVHRGQVVCTRMDVYICICMTIWCVCVTGRPAERWWQAVQEGLWGNDDGPSRTGRWLRRDGQHTRRQGQAGSPLAVAVLHFMSREFSFILEREVHAAPS